MNHPLYGSTVECNDRIAASIVRPRRPRRKGLISYTRPKRHARLNSGPTLKPLVVNEERHHCGMPKTRPWHLCRRVQGISLMASEKTSNEGRAAVVSGPRDLDIQDACGYKPQRMSI